MTYVARKLVLSLIAASTLSLGAVQASHAKGAVTWSGVATEQTRTVQQIHHREIRRKQVRRILRRNGFHNIHDIRRKGRIYVAHAVTSYGRDAKIKVHARSGEILSVRHKQAHRAHGKRQVRKTIQRLRHKGFHNFSHRRQRNGLVIFKATNRYGERIKFKIDRYSGRVVKRKFVGYDHRAKPYHTGSDFNFTSPDGSFSLGVSF
ncbi:hypothetical protein [Coralliovum pocilloporae]|uniref:hypothetical protein n=1 Tax=Coralliovum pocilloporae TaxID=3066369 RepID=UPI0033077BCF